VGSKAMRPKDRRELRGHIASLITKLGCLLVGYSIRVLQK
jgi:hypothetical protein